MLSCTVQPNQTNLKSLETLIDSKTSQELDVSKIHLGKQNRFMAVDGRTNVGACLCGCAFTHLPAYLDVYVRAYVRKKGTTHGHVHAYVSNMCVYIYIYINMYIHKYVQRHLNMYIYTYIERYTYVHACPCSSMSRIKIRCLSKVPPRPHATAEVQKLRKLQEHSCSCRYGEPCRCRAQFQRGCRSRGTFYLASQRIRLEYSDHVFQMSSCRTRPQ